MRDTKVIENIINDDYAEVSPEEFLLYIDHYPNQAADKINTLGRRIVRAEVDVALLQIEFLFKLVASEKPLVRRSAAAAVQYIHECGKRGNDPHPAVPLLYDYIRKPEQLKILANQLMPQGSLRSSDTERINQLNKYAGTHHSWSCECPICTCGNWRNDELDRDSRYIVSQVLCKVCDEAATEVNPLSPQLDAVAAVLPQFVAVAEKGYFEPPDMGIIFVARFLAKYGGRDIGDLLKNISQREWHPAIAADLRNILG